MRGSERGFSLLEVVVALAILGLVLAVLADSVRGGLLGGAKAAAVEVLLAEAESRIASIGTVEPLEPGTRQGNDGDLHWRLEIREFRDAKLDLDDSGLPRAYRVKVTVTSEQGGAARSLALETVRLRLGEEK
jgi:general secretion pathway protein I